MNECLNVFGVASDGKLWHTALTIHGATGAWSSWEDVQTQGAGEHSPFISVDSAFISTLIGGDLHVCGITNDGKLLHTVTSASQWEPFEDITARIGGNWGALRDVAITDVDDDLHFCVLALTTSGEPHILHTVLHADGTWDGVQDVSTIPSVGFPGPFVSIDCAGVGDDLHVCGVTNDGKLWHTMYSSPNNWTPFEDVGALSTNAPGPFTAVTLAEGDTDLHVLAQVGADLWHTMRSSNPPGWQSAFDNVKAQAGDPGSLSSVDCTGGNAGSNLFHVCCLTGDGKLWHAIRFSNPLVWSHFEDVTAGAVGAPGPFNEICLAAFDDDGDNLLTADITDNPAHVWILCEPVGASWGKRSGRPPKDRGSSPQYGR